MVLIFFLFSGIGFHPIALLFPLLIIELYVFALALAFFLSALYVKYRDINYVWELLIQAAFYATPIIYPMSFVISKNLLLAKLMLLNPMAQIIQDSRYILISSETTTLAKLSSNWVVVLIPIILVVALVMLAGYYFRKNARYFAEEV